MTTLIYLYNLCFLVYSILVSSRPLTQSLLSQYFYSCFLSSAYLIIASSSILFSLPIVSLSNPCFVVISILASSHLLIQSLLPRHFDSCFLSSPYPIRASSSFWFLLSLISLSNPCFLVLSILASSHLLNQSLLPRHFDSCFLSSPYSILDSSSIRFLLPLISLSNPCFLVISILASSHLLIQSLLPRHFDSCFLSSPYPILASSSFRFLLPLIYLSNPCFLVISILASSHLLIQSLLPRHFHSCFLWSPYPILASASFRFLLPLISLSNPCFLVISILASSHLLIQSLLPRHFDSCFLSSPYPILASSSFRFLLPLISLSNSCFPVISILASSHLLIQSLLSRHFDCCFLSSPYPILASSSFRFLLPLISLSNPCFFVISILASSHLLIQSLLPRHFDSCFLSSPYPNLASSSFWFLLSLISLSNPCFLVLSILASSHLLIQFLLPRHFDSCFLSSPYPILDSSSIRFLLPLISLSNPCFLVISILASSHLLIQFLLPRHFDSCFLSSTYPILASSSFRFLLPLISLSNPCFLVISILASSHLLIQSLLPRHFDSCFLLSPYPILASSSFRFLLPLISLSNPCFLVISILASSHLLIQSLLPRHFDSCFLSSPYPILASSSFQFLLPLISLSNPCFLVISILASSHLLIQSLLLRHFDSCFLSSPYPILASSSFLFLLPLISLSNSCFLVISILASSHLLIQSLLSRHFDCCFLSSPYPFLACSSFRFLLPLISLSNPCFLVISIVASSNLSIQSVLLRHFYSCFLSSPYPILASSSFLFLLPLVSLSNLFILVYSNFSSSSPLIQYLLPRLFNFCILSSLYPIFVSSSILFLLPLLSLSKYSFLVLSIFSSSGLFIQCLPPCQFYFCFL